MLNAALEVPKNCFRLLCTLASEMLYFPRQLEQRRESGSAFAFLGLLAAPRTILGFRVLWGLAALVAGLGA